jgi:hypothetical protein
MVFLFAMKRPPNTPEFARFSAALGDILKVSPTEMHTRIETQKQSGKRLAKGSASLGAAASSKIRAALGDS